ncbi:MAG: MBL fold metallo-hydrolase [Thermoleophilia bacterium]|nr:MBL fold metallo-hydrolase [Thermoleophilia bacterium]
MADALAIADDVAEVVAGVWHWSVHDTRIDFTSSSHAVAVDEGAVLVDPMPLAAPALERLGPVAAICLTSGSHQRASWQLRRALGAPLWAPALSQTLAEEPDGRYDDGDRLPGGLLAVFTPGAGTTQHTLLLERDEGVAFAPDLFVRRGDGGLAFVDARYMHDPHEARRSAQKLLGLPFTVLCLGHGAPLVENARGSLRRLLEDDGQL